MAYQDQFPTNWDTALIKPSFSFVQERNTNYHDPNMELMMNEQQCILASVDYYHPSLLENSNLSSTYQSITNNSTSYDSDLIIIQQQQQQEVVPEFHGKLQGNSGQMTVGNVGNYNGSYKKRKTEDCGVGAESSNLTCVSEMGTTAGKNKQKSRKGKSKEKEEDKKSKEVVHVRARSGQATGSHSLAERVRREKINKKMKCLQDMVPGCYKSMGMATMLDEIINYVQSLQNQVEFLSMKLAGAAASTFYYDCYYNRSETELAMEKLQKQTQQEANKFLNGGCIDQQQAQEALALFHSSSTVWSN